MATKAQWAARRARLRPLRERKKRRLGNLWFGNPGRKQYVIRIGEYLWFLD